MTKEEKLELLLRRMMEYLEQQIAKMQGKPRTCYVVMDDPESGCETFLRCEPDLTAGGAGQMRLRTSMRFGDSDRIVSHYVYRGTVEECGAWLRDPATEAALREDIASLRERVQEDL